MLNFREERNTDKTAKNNTNKHFGTSIGGEGDGRKWGSTPHCPPK